MIGRVSSELGYLKRQPRRLPCVPFFFRQSRISPPARPTHAAYTEKGPEAAAVHQHVHFVCIQSRVCTFIVYSVLISGRVSQREPPAFRYPVILHRTSAPKSRSSPWASAGCGHSLLFILYFVYLLIFYPRHPFIYFPQSPLFQWEIPCCFDFIYFSCGQPGRQRSLGRRKGGHATHPLPPHPLYCRRYLGHGPTSS